MAHPIQRSLPVLAVLVAGCPDPSTPPAEDASTGAPSTGPSPSSSPGPTSDAPGSTTGAEGVDVTGSDSTAASPSTGEVADRQPPALELLTPRAGRMTPVRRIRLAGTATDDVALLELVADLGGAPIPIEVEDDGSFDVPLDLAPGDNQGVLVARDEAGNETELAIDVYFGHRISVGNSQSAFLRDGVLLTWGRNEQGQLGNGTLEGSGYGDDPRTSMLPVRYELPAPELVSVVTRQAFMIALRDDGQVLTWGSNSDGQLGYLAESDCGASGTSPCRRDPTPVPGITGAIAVAAGYRHSLVLLEDGTVISFGDNTHGQLGRPTPDASTEEPALVESLSGVIQVAAGSDCSFALTETGQVHAWGENDRGQLGLGMADALPHPTPTPVPGLADVAELAAANTTTFARLHDGTVWSWGRNHTGQAGIGDESGGEILVPTAVVVQTPGGTTEPLAGTSNIAGDGFVGLSLSPEAELMAWGLGSLGQLGQGYLDDGTRDLEARWVASPVWVDPSIAMIFDVVELEVGAGGPAMALTSSGDLFGWGWSFRGSLGLEGAIDAWAYSAPFLVLAAD